MEMLNYVIDLFLLFLTYSCFGWVIEVIFVSIDSKRFVNRGFLIGTNCPIYGTVGIAISLLLQKYASDYIVVFILSAVIASILEYITSYLMEKLFKARWWDYSKKKFNLNGRICLENTAFLGPIEMVMLCFLTPRFGAVTKAIPPNVKYHTSHRFSSNIYCR